MNIYFVLELRIFVIMGSSNGFCYFCFGNVCDDEKY